MPAQVPLIVKRDPVTSLAPVPARTPDVAVVYATADGQVTTFDANHRRDGWTKRIFARYRWRYEVDVGDHRRTLELRTSPLPARGDAYHFDTTFDVGFRVVDASAVVARDVEDGLTVVYNHLINVCRPITRSHDIGDAVGAEEEVNARFRHGEDLDEGILIYRCHARLASASYAEFQRDQDGARRTNIVDAARHDVAVDNQKRENQLAKIKQDGDLVRRRAERDDMDSAVLDPAELIRMHLARFPSDTRTAMTLLQELERSRWEREEIRDQRANELFRFMADRNLVHAVDMANFRERVVGQLSDSRPVDRPAASGSASAALPVAPVVPVDIWSAPLPGASAVPDQEAPRAVEGPSSSAAEPPRAEAVDTADTAAGHVVPVYVLIDRSVAVKECLDELNAGIETLFSGLADDQAVAAIIRLAVIGYAEDASLRVDLTSVRNGACHLQLTTGGESRYSVAFEQLLSCIPRDVETLKGQRSTVRRPQVLFLTGGRPADEASWGPVYQRLIDRHTMRYAPEVIAFGFGDTTPSTLLRIATSRELAFIADEASPGSAVERFFAFAVRQMIGYGRAALQGYAGPVVTVPPGFRAVDPS